MTLIEVFEDTLCMFENNATLKEQTQISVANSKVYKEGFVCKEKLIRNTSSTNITVVPKSTFECAIDISHLSSQQRIAVLNFANPYEPGGGVKRGAKAQEECLCRCSNLYQVISGELCNNEYYQYHKRKNGYLFSDRVIYSPDVIIIKNDQYEKLYDSYCVDVLTCAAPYNVYGHDIEVLKSTYRSRIVNILEVAANNQVDYLVLGAFGCGAFHNSPQLMAEAFKYVLVDMAYSKYFKNVYFAVIKPKSAFDRNFVIFQKVFEEQKSL